MRIVPFAADFASQALAGPKIGAWYARVAAIGHGRPAEASAEDAIQLAKQSEPAGGEGGPRVVIRTEQSGDDPVEGTLLRCDAGGITVRRTIDRSGAVNVHFPRIGQIVVPL